MKIPKEVEEEAQYLIDMYGNKIEYLGQSKGADYYIFQFPKDEQTGFPVVYQYENHEVFTITNFEALDIIDLFIKE